MWLGVGGVGLGTLALFPSERDNLVFGLRAASRFIRDAICVVRIAVDYHQSLAAFVPGQGQTRDELLEQIHRRSAIALRDLFCKNSGIYIKVGQHMNQLEHLLPGPYVHEMEIMLDQAPQSSFEDVCAVVHRDLGAGIKDVFETFDPEPIASASLAQVHVATLKKSHRKVAVKVQHKDLKQIGMMDLKFIYVLVKAVHWFYPHLDYRWLIEESMENLPKELNFINEGKNAERFSRNIAHLKNVCAPKIHWDFTSERVLTMDFEEGTSLVDVNKIQQQGIDTRDVSLTVAKVFCEQTFLHGFVHCDPHPGNILVRKNKRNQTEVVILDHGLYRELSDEFRLAYCHLWKAVIFGNEEEIEYYSRMMNVADMYPLFASVLTHRPFHRILDATIESLEIPRTEASREELQEYAGAFLLDINDILTRVPRELLLLLKMNDCLRALDSRLQSSLSSFVTIARYCIKAINRHRTLSSPGLTSTFLNLRDELSFNLRLLALRLLKALNLLRFWTTGL